MFPVSSTISLAVCSKCQVQGHLWYVPSLKYKVTCGMFQVSSTSSLVVMFQVSSTSSLVVCSKSQVQAHLRLCSKCQVQGHLWYVPSLSTSSLVVCIPVLKYKLNLYAPSLKYKLTVVCSLSQYKPTCGYVPSLKYKLTCGMLPSLKYKLTCGIFPVQVQAHLWYVPSLK
ncbi:hypothetical protein DPMN_071379 [Dreissena polymorpha]|uniref:Uncharacterized protein n=1 Tax=Dreissena polymorpha TaxID=45954 RepID=A0A9D4BW87_DREPO|nr:hypothetical protein DPMN_071379 [Dreissena polymorpha]